MYILSMPTGVHVVLFAVWFCGRMHRKDAQASAEAKRLLVYWLERFLLEFKAASLANHMVILMDMSGCGLQQMVRSFLVFFIFLLVKDRAVDIMIVSGDFG